LNTTRVVALLSQEAANQDNTSSLRFPNFFEVFVDGIWQPSLDDPAHSFSTSESDVWLERKVVPIVLAENLSPVEVHNIVVFKSTEAQYCAMYIGPNFMTLHGVELEGPSLPKAFATSEVRTASRRLEFIGDSITVGYCNLCKDSPSDTDAASESHALSWPKVLSESVDAEFHTIAWSGYGLVNNCCGGDNTVMPQIFTRTLASVDDSSGSWDYSSWVPDAVIINLGTNDLNSGLYDEDTFVTAYLALALNITAAYGPQCALFLACGPMATEYCGGVERTLEALEAGKGISGYPDSAFFLDQTASNPNLEPLSLACCNHPTSADDALLASAGAAFVKSSLGWP
jgi:hypothetical protein